MMQLQQQQVAHNRFRSTWLHAATYTEGTLTYTYTVLHIQYDFVVTVQGKCEILGKIQNARKFWQRCAAQAFKP